uniref:Uncharacterized protein n=1 Tax=Arundo donax TaxID=35708 RepID=A0A0A9C8F0_ARUDO
MMKHSLNQTILCSLDEYFLGEKDARVR